MIIEHDLIYRNAGSGLPSVNRSKLDIGDTMMPDVVSVFGWEYSKHHQEWYLGELVATHYHTRDDPPFILVVVNQ